MKKFIRSIWEFPQNALGYIILKVTKAENHGKWIGSHIYVWRFNNGLSLGKYIFVPHNANTQFVMHEYGHVIQSRYLGWFYLLVIGLPSLIWCGCFGKYREKHNISYYDFYTEKWADELGGVER